MKYGTICATLAALSLLPASAPAKAQVSFAATVGNLRYTLTDLAPDDGIAPSVTFAGPVQAYLAGELEQFAPQSAPSWTGQRTTTGDAVLLQDWDSGAHVGVGYDGRTLVAAAALDPAVLGFSTSVLAQGQHAFTLAPHTRVTFTVDAAIDLTLGQDPAKLGHAQTFAGIAVDHSPVGTVFDVGTWGLKAHGALVDNDDPLYGPTYANFVMDPITLSWDNDASVQGGATVSFVAGGWGQLVDTGAIPPVPEPGAWTMLLAGLGALGARARHRRLHLERNRHA